MRRGWKIAIGVLAALLALLLANSAVAVRETKQAEVTVPGGQLLDLSGTRVQVLDRGPRRGSPIVLVHCFTCSIDWWLGMLPRLQREHRVVAIDLLGHGGSDKPASGYSVAAQADLVAQALGRLGVRGATVVGHSLGGAVAVALAERSPQLVERVAVIGTPPAPEEDNLGFVANLGFQPLIGEALWRIKPDFAVREGLQVAFAPGYDVPDVFVDDVDRMTYSAYEDSHRAFDEYAAEAPLDRRIRETGKPLLVVMGDEEQIIADPAAAIREYGEAVPTTISSQIRGVGHSPNVEEPLLTAELVLGFSEQKVAANRQKRRR